MTHNQCINTEETDVAISVDADDKFSVGIELSQNDVLQNVRSRTFSHWENPTSEFINEMKEAGFFGCNISDRVTCIDCKIFCEQWMPDADDPREVHKNLSPNCPYVKANLFGPLLSPPLLETSHTMFTSLSSTVNTTTSATDVHVNAQTVIKISENLKYAQITERMSSFDGWSNENAPFVNDLAKAGFFYTGTNDVVKCFYCDGTIHACESNSDLIIQHIKDFPKCNYALQLCDPVSYWKIQLTQRPQLGLKPLSANEWIERHSKCRSDANNLEICRLAFIPDQDSFDELIAERLKLPASQRIMNKRFDPLIVKKCWTDQLRIKGEDFLSELELSTACQICEQTEYINNNSQDIIIPRLKMMEIAEIQLRSASNTLKNFTKLTTTTPSSSTAAESTDDPSLASTEMIPNKTGLPEISRLCIMCRKKEKQLACIPCGHSVSCIECRKLLRSCPICLCRIKLLIRVYLA